MIGEQIIVKANKHIFGGYVYSIAFIIALTVKYAQIIQHIVALTVLAGVGFIGVVGKGTVLVYNLPRIHAISAF